MHNEVLFILDRKKDLFGPTNFWGGGITKNTTNTITFVYKVGKLGSRLKLKLPIVKAFEKYLSIFLIFL